MDFFEAQDRAKRQTTRLVIYYVLAVLGIIGSVYIVTLLLFYSQSSGEGAVSFWNPGWLVGVSFLVLATILIGTIYRVVQLRKGGSAVAEMLGGRKVNPSTIDLKEQVLLNVVEEMSIASGISVPDIYILDHEASINAFAAGYTVQDAAVGVTRGALEQLNRDELQGVIAHEFSHIFNGDMRFNIRLIGILNGILLIHIIGMIIMRSVMYSGARVRRNQDGKGNNGQLVIILFGVALVIIGYIGMIFGRIIQAAISRQREYLADAAAVQYTRNPDGLAGALRKIAGKKAGSELKNAHAMEMSHLFFANSFKTALNGLFATHPPIKKRIQALSANYIDEDSLTQSKVSEKFQKDHVAGQKPLSADRGILRGHDALSPEVILGAIGSVGGRDLQQASSFLHGMPDALRQAAHDPLSAKALIFAMLDTAPVRVNQEWLSSRLDPATLQETERLSTLLTPENQQWFLPLAELAVPALRTLGREQYHDFREILGEVIQQEEPENMFLFALEKMVIHHLDASFSTNKRPEVKYQKLEEVTAELSVLLSALCHISGDDPEKGWRSAMEPLQNESAKDKLKLLDQEIANLAAVDKALDQLASTSNPLKKSIVSSVIYCITADQKITTGEAELTRAISEVLGVPIPIGAVR